MADTIAEIKNALKDNKLVFGADMTLKGLKQGMFARIYTASNCPEQLKADIEHYASIAGVEVTDTGVPNDELGDVCKKPFAIAVMGLKK